MQFKGVSLQCIRNSMMKHTKSVANSRHWTGGLTARTFVRAACLSTILVGVGCSSAFLASALTFRDGTVLKVGLVLIPGLTVAIWVIAAVLGMALLLPTLLWAKIQKSVPRTDRWTCARSGVWDDWLDGPISEE
jgi:hypothetical protein